MEQSIPVIWSEVMQEWVLIDVMPGSISPLRPSAVLTLPIESSSSFSPSSSSLITSAQPQLLTNTSVSNFEVLTTGQSSTVDSSVYQELTSAEFVASDNQAFVVQGSVDQEGVNGGGDGNSGEELQYLVLGRMQHVPVPDQALNLSSSDGVDPNCWGDSCPCKAYESQVLYSVKCNGCFRSIGPSELVMRVAGGAIYHTDCFTCGRCGRHLTKGDEFALRRGGLLCRRDLDACLLDVSLSGGNSGVGNGVSIAGAVEPNSPDGCAAGENSGNGNGRGPISPGGGADLGAMMGDTGPTVEHCGQLEAAGNYSPRTSCEIVLGVANIKSEIANTNSSSSPYSPSNSNNGGGGQQGSQQQSQQSVQPPPNVKPDGRRGPKRPRTILTTAQRRAFKASFEISQKPCRKVRETLAKETGLSVRIVQVWFQNQRAKLKKIQRKQQQAALVHGGGGGNGGGGGGNGSHGGGGGNGNGFLNGSESGTGMGSAHSSDKSKDDSTDDEDDDCSSQANTAFGSVSGNTTGNMQSMAGYGMLQSPDGSYYSTGREDDSTGGGGGGGGNGGNYMMTSGAKSDLGALDDSETSLCELDDGNGILVRPNSTGVPPLHGGGNFGPGGGPGATSMMSPLELTCLTGGGVGQPSMFSPNITGNMIMPFGGGVGGGLPLPPQQLGPNHLLTTSSSVSESSLTPIDKLYSMQNSYFSSSSTGGNPQEQECL